MNLWGLWYYYWESKKKTEKNKIFQRKVELGRRREFEIRIRGFGKVKVDLRFEIRIGKRYVIRVENLWKGK